jgi:hypothetical protein
MIQWSHHQSQQITSLATAIGRPLGRHSAIESVAIPVTCPLVPHTRGKLHLISKPRKVKRDTTKLGSKSSLEALKMNFLVLVVQLIVMSEHIRSRMTPARSDNPDEFPNLNYNIWCKLMQLNPELA